MSSHQEQVDKLSLALSTDEFEVLPWDSRFFGIKVARIFTDGYSESKLATVLDSLSKLAVQLVYYATPNIQSLSTQFLLKSNGLLVDEKVTYRVNLKTHSKCHRRNNRIEVYENTAPNERMLRLAVLSGKYSRFNKDPKLCKKFAQLYETWIRNSVAGSMADRVFVYKIHKEIVGMTTVSSNKTIGRIGLMSVSEDTKRIGIGKHLTEHAIDWFINAGDDEAIVVTQAENKPACRLYESCGFEMSKKEYVYHFWLEPDARAVATTNML